MSHNDCFALTIKDLLHGNWTGGSSVDDAFIMFDWNENTFAVEHRPRFADHTINLLLEVGGNMRKIHVLTHLSFVLLGDEFQMVSWVEWRI